MTAHRRVPHTPDERPRTSLSIRLRNSLRARIQEAATANGRSLSEEIEHRLELNDFIKEVRKPREDSDLAKATREGLEYKIRSLANELEKQQRLNSVLRQEANVRESNVKKQLLNVEKEFETACDRAVSYQSVLLRCADWFLKEREHALKINDPRAAERHARHAKAAEREARAVWPHWSEAQKEQTD